MFAPVLGVDNTLPTQDLDIIKKKSKFFLLKPFPIYRRNNELLLLILTKLWCVPIQLPDLDGEDGGKGDPGQVGEEEHPSQGAYQVEAPATPRYSQPQG